MTVPIALATLAERNRLPTKFLEQIMATLKHAGVVRTTLGAHGGYALAADPSSVSIGRVIRLLDGALAPLGCVSLRYYEPCSCVDEATCPLRDVMIDVRDAMLEILDTETLAELAARPGRAVDRSARPPRRRPGGPPALKVGTAPPALKVRRREMKNEARPPSVTRPMWRPLPGA